jgi:hypothetical protein
MVTPRPGSTPHAKKKVSLAAGRIVRPKTGREVGLRATEGTGLPAHGAALTCQQARPKILASG